MRFEWNLGSRSLVLGERTLIMGVVNVTPDSFSDGGLHFDPKQAVAHALALLERGADIVDIGGESTRPGANVARAPSSRHVPAVSEQEELRRTLPVIEAIKKERPEAIISTDTYKAAVAKAAVGAGAEIVNDVSGFTWDAEMLPTLTGLKCGAVLMHMRGRPEEWRKLPPLPDPAGLVQRELGERAASAVHAGIARDRLVLDPGLGFGKNFGENYPLLASVSELHALGFPLLAGVSRKSFIGRTLARDGQDAPADQRLHGTLAAEAALALAGVQIIRTHDVEACRDAVLVADSIRLARGAH